MPPINLENATVSMYENVSLTEELTDEPATALLQWGAGQIKSLAVKHEPDATEEGFENDFKQLRKLMKSINRFTSRRHTMTDEERTEYFNKRIIQVATDLGFAIDDEQVSKYMETQTALDATENVHTLTTLITTGQINPPEDNPDGPRLTE